MNRNGRRKKYRLFLLIILLIFTVTVGCSTLGNYFGRVFSSDEEKLARYQENSLKQLLANARPQAGNPESHFLLGKYYQERGRHKEAIGEFRKTLLINPQHGMAMNGLGISYDLLGDYPKAIEAYQMALQLNPNQDYTHNNLGYSYLMQGNIEEAIASFNRALALNNKKEIYHNNLGLAYFKKGERDLALNELKSTGNEAQAHYLIANLFYEQGDYQQAKEAYTEALKINPEMKQAKTKMEAVETLAKITETGNPKTETAKVVFKIGNSEQSPSANPVGGIEVSNGNGVTRMARGVAEYLKEHDLKVIRLTNADHFAYSETRLYCQKEFLSTAQEVNKRLPLPLKIQEVKKLDRPAIKVKLIIGKDLVNHKTALEIRTRS
jgi:tetratricopeptide (TPR) repeat protein